MRVWNFAARCTKHTMIVKSQRQDNTKCDRHFPASPQETSIQSVFSASNSQSGFDMYTRVQTAIRMHKLQSFYFLEKKDTAFRARETYTTCGREKLVRLRLKELCGRMHKSRSIPITDKDTCETLKSGVPHAASWQSSNYRFRLHAIEYLVCYVGEKGNTHYVS